MALLLDASFVIDLLHGQARAQRAAQEIDGTGETVLLPTPTLYEVRTGLARPGARRQAARFDGLAAAWPSLALDAAAAEKAAEIRAEFIARGTPMAAVDLLLSGMAIAGGHTLLTADAGFDEVSEAFGLRVRRY